MNSPLRSLQDDLRQDAFPWLMLPYALAGFALLTIWDAPSGPVATLGLMLLALTAALWLMRRRFFSTAAWALCLASLALVFLAWRWFPDVGAYQAFVFPVLVASLVLGFAASIAIAAIASALLIYGMGFSPATSAATSVLAAEQPAMC